MHKRRSLVGNGKLKVVDIPCNSPQRITQSLKFLLEAAIESDKDIYLFPRRAQLNVLQISF